MTRRSERVESRDVSEDVPDFPVRWTLAAIGSGSLSPVMGRRQANGSEKVRTPMVIFGAAPIGFVLIETVQQASEFLSDHRSGNDSRAWTDAMKHCSGRGNLDDANVAFLAALRGAGISYDPAIVLY
jgi:hypothetical protein